MCPAVISRTWRWFSNQNWITKIAFLHVSSCVAVISIIDIYKYYIDCSKNNHSQLEESNSKFSFKGKQSSALIDFMTWWFAFRLTWFTCPITKCDSTMYIHLNIEKHVIDNRRSLNGKLAVVHFLSSLWLSLYYRMLIFYLRTTCFHYSHMSMNSTHHMLLMSLFAWLWIFDHYSHDILLVICH